MFWPFALAAPPAVATAGAVAPEAQGLAPGVCCALPAAVVCPRLPVHGAAHGRRARAHGVRSSTPAFLQAPPLLLSSVAAPSCNLQGLSVAPSCNLWPPHATCGPLMQSVAPSCNLQGLSVACPASASASSTYTRPSCACPPSYLATRFLRDRTLVSAHCRRGMCAAHARKQPLAWCSAGLAPP